MLGLLTRMSNRLRNVLDRCVMGDGIGRSFGSSGSRCAVQTLGGLGLLVRKLITVFSNTLAWKTFTWTIDYIGVGKDIGRHRGWCWKFFCWVKYWCSVFILVAAEAWTYTVPHEYLMVACQYLMWLRSD